MAPHEHKIACDIGNILSSNQSRYTAKESPRHGEYCEEGCLHIGHVGIRLVL